MKTAQDYIKEIHPNEEILDLEILLIDFEDAMKDYAQQCCEDLRERIAENATLEPNGMLLQVDKQSILETEIILP